MVDSPPQLSLISVNVLQAVDQVLVPLDPGIFSVAGLGRLQETVARVRKYLEHPELAIIGLLMTKMMRNKATQALEKQLREVYPSLTYRVTIPYGTVVEESHASWKSIMERGSTIRGWKGVR